MQRAQSNQPKIDLTLVGLLGTVVFIGLVMLFSASIAYAEERYANEFFFVIRQTIALGLGLVAAYVVYQIPLSTWIHRRGGLLLLSLLLLVAVLIVGMEINGSKRWLPLGVFNFQPSELMKFSVIVFMAAYLTLHKSEVSESFTAVLRLALPFGFMALLLILEPDFGSVMVITMIIVGMLLISGAPYRFFVYTIIPMIGILAALLLLEPYRIARLTSFFDPWQDPYGTGYQLIQAILAQGSGGWTGVGLGNSVQKMLYLPDAHTDFIFSIFAEEFGFLGVLGLVVLYLAVIYRLFRIAYQAKQANYNFGALYVYGVSFWFVLQVGINMGANLGVIPTKGLTLPLFSYGGSSMILFLIAFALVLKVEHVSRFYPDPKNSDDYDLKTDQEFAAEDEEKKAEKAVKKTRKVRREPKTRAA
ncbi:putative lipid II flippase FtsW [Thiomicrorhabdus xiamenensis]|uniref:Probable peptidoglycan glycosyltransferase FtsW n=1 Tax=Thiomicrorhabdus xiamenensis TaxID=2739063 RepID=A0A7D4SHT7_9GAMM|nr:putative lipid II flippase FtsW [Thiomicrorhabdus xiamenensis]QKI88700.1 putative lipid II flippase FtsW [Thiomicrorhabdus xiamenensis]